MKSPVIQSVDLDDLRVEIETYLDEELSSKYLCDFTFNIPLIYAQPIDIQALNNILYIIKEFVINMKKHSSATMIFISCDGTPLGLSLTLEENGKGFKMDTVDRQHHFGILSIQNRVEVCAGKIKWDTKNKTKCSIFIPWKGLNYEPAIDR